MDTVPSEVNVGLMVQSAVRDCTMSHGHKIKHDESKHDENKHDEVKHDEVKHDMTA